MVKQTMISVKLDSYQLRMLDELCLQLGCKRNKLINFFVSQGISNLSSHRECAIIAAYQKALNELL